MSTMLNFYDAAWINARELAVNGRHHAARVSLEPLLSADDAPANLKLLAYRLAARLAMHGERHRKARQHLYAAEKLDPQNAEIHYEIGLAFERDPYGCDRRAARRYKRAANLAPANDLYRAMLGRALVRINCVRAGVSQLRTVVNCQDLATLEILVDGFNDAGKIRESEALVRNARFLKLNDGKVRQLNNDVRFATALRRQQKTHRRTRLGLAPKVLPFLRIAGTSGNIRHDGKSMPRPHVGRIKAFRTERG